MALFANGLLYLIVIAGFAGLSRGLFHRTEVRLDNIDHVLVGYCLALLACGVASSVDVNAPLVFMACVCAGLALAGVRDRAHWWATLSSVRGRVAVGLLLVLFVMFGQTLFFNPGDDFVGYLPLWEKARQIGYLTPDPFSQNRFAAGLPAAILMSSVASNVFGSINAGMVFEHALPLGYFIIKIATGRTDRIAVALAIATLVMFINANSYTYFGATTTSNALMAALVYLLHQGAWSLGAADKRPSARDIGALSVVLAGVLALKSTGLVFAAIAVAHAVVFSPAASAQASRFGLIAGRSAMALVIAGLAVVLLLPQAIEQLQSSRTVYFPFTGPGNYISSYEQVPFIVEGLTSRLAVAAQAIATYAPLMVLLAGAAIVTISPRRTALADIALYGAVVLVCLVMTASSGFANNGLRYIYPVALFLVVYKLAAGSVSRATDMMRMLGVTALAIWAWSLDGRGADIIHRVASNVVLAARGDFAAAAEVGSRVRYVRFVDPRDPQSRQALARLQALTPAGTSIIVDLLNAVPLDYRRNNILPLGNCPGLSSPPDGIPLFKNEALFDSYMARVGVDYALVEYDRYTKNPGDFAVWARSPAPWVAVCGRGTIRFREKIMRSPDVVGDDGRYRLIRFPKT